MEHLLVDISDPAVGLQVKSFLKSQKGVQFKSVFEGDKLTEDERHQRIMAASDAVHAGEQGINWEDFVKKLEVKKKKYEISQEVLTQLKEIYAYNFTHYHKERAEKILNSIDEVFQKAANNPNFYPPYLNNTYPNRNLRRAIIHKT